MQFKSIDIIKSLLLLLLSISGNFIAETLGCKTQYILSNFMFIKELIVILTIFFTLSYINDKSINPINNLKYTIFIWSLFIMFTKMNLYMTVICFTLLIINYIIHIYIEHYRENKHKHKNIINKLEKLYNYINYLNIFLIILGFSSYFYTHYKNIGKSNFKISKFLFGITKCTSIK